MSSRLVLCLPIALAAALLCTAASAAPPNVVFIQTDQPSAALLLSRTHLR